MIFDDVKFRLNNSKLNFSEKVNDSFGRSIVNDVYEPFELDLQKMSFAWEEAESRKKEIMTCLMNLRMII